MRNKNNRIQIEKESHDNYGHVKFNKSSDNILIISINTGIGLSLVRSLGKRGINVYGIGSSRTSIGFFSKYLKKGFILPNFKWNENELEYIQRVIEIIQENNINYILAISEPLLLLLNEHRDKIEKYAKLLIPTYSLLDKVFDKKKTLETAQKLGIPIPKTIYLDEDLPDIEYLKKEFDTFPIVIKPIHRVYTQKIDIKRDFKIKYIYSYESLIKTLQDLKGYPVMVQEFCAGEGLTICVFRFREEILAIFQYKVIHAYPPIGGASVYRESVEINSKVKEYTLRLLEEIGWEGPCEVEMRQEYKTGMIKLMEINGRFWGALPLAIKAGVDFPYLTYQAFGKGGKIFINEYKIGVKCCLLGAELQWILASLFSNRKGIKEKIKAICEFIGTFYPKIKHDIQSIDDPLPGIMDILIILTKPYYLFSEFYRKIRN